MTYDNTRSTYLNGERDGEVDSPQENKGEKKKQKINPPF